MYCGCKMNWAAAYWVTLMRSVFNTERLVFNTESKPLITRSLQLVCNHGNHSVPVKATYLFLQCIDITGRNTYIYVLVLYESFVY